MLVDHSPWTYALIQSGIFVFGYLGLFCLAYFLVALFSAGVPGISHPFSVAVEAVGALEGLWYLLWFLPWRAYLSRPGVELEVTGREERAALFGKLLDHIPDLPLFLRRWFNGAHLDEIYRDDLKDWLSWALWNRKGHRDEDDEELEELISEAEARDPVGHGPVRFRPGRAGATAIRASLDPVAMRHASLLWYAVVGAVDGLTTTWLLLRGFRFYAQPAASFFTNFPPRPLTLLSPPGRRSAAPEYSYFYRPHRSRTHRPVAFFHGIGIGLFPYLAFLEMLPRDVGVLAVEFMPVSGRVCPESPSQRGFARAMREVVSQLDPDLREPFVFVGHSYGTLMARSLLRDEVVGPKIHSLVLCDPVSLLMHLPALAYNIMRRVPRTAPELEMRWFAAADPRTAHTVTRRLHWQDCILWREDLKGKRTTVVLGERDCVTDPGAVASYVWYGDVRHRRPDHAPWLESPRTWSGERELELMYLRDRDHGQSLLVPAEMRRVFRVVEKYCRREEALGNPEAPRQASSSIMEEGGEGKVSSSSTTDDEEKKRRRRKENEEKGIAGQPEGSMGEKEMVGEEKRPRLSADRGRLDDGVDPGFESARESTHETV